MRTTRTILTIAFAVAGGCAGLAAPPLGVAPKEEQPTLPRLPWPGASAYPALCIARGDLRLTLYVPDPARGYYRGPRFDWSGLICRAEWRGHYNHNFVSIDDQPVGPSYRVAFTFPVKLNRSLRGFAEARGNGLVFLKELGDEQIFSEIHGLAGDVRDADIAVENVKTRAGVRIVRDRAPTKANFYAASTAACPEAFATFSLGPGERATWKSTYALFER